MKYTQESNWFIYILKCSDETFYTGITNNITKRVCKHNSGKGAKYTSTRLPVILMYYKLIGTMSEALKEERITKKLSHKQKEKLVTYVQKKL